ncbi:transcriptional regulator GutM [Aggregatibacter actinomycetemcomitans]|uniref:transcriptional regulator GutM n=1 Tax=Aggregatibacter actinomycetemcomitans TaxID=714 RepID=UPI00197C1F21|nr:transcriptional regulator GutM [Aggregatibacter actinomycetemcomitans]MBN6063630.1 transcriptional regulator GutM [Aggregatibacter actinomycetemcomitans]MBN6076127.1 transcriptional regulator GutM [Aggregatibacter actinomycetemcomitans]MBN6081510.1 transcriptional regulator GutM [Aggregatibacter actinomycetemcomitans]MBN6084461.1 transcriptional regulator GutM [Aggregatibacter actinomycetemcomitans]
MQNTTNTLIFIAVGAWLLQILLGWWQVSRFNKAFELLCKQGKVGIGRTKGRFKAKAVVAVAFDENRYVTNSIMMKGLTVFSRPQPIPALKGLHYDEIRPDVIFPADRNAQEALAEAIRLT